MKVLFLVLGLTIFYVFAYSNTVTTVVCSNKNHLIDTPPPPQDNPFNAPNYSTPYIDDTIICTLPIQNMSIFKGGENAMREYLKNNIKIDFGKYNDSFPRTVWVKVIIDTPGRVLDPKIVKNGLDSSFNTSIIKVISDMPKWVPSEFRGVRIKQKVVIPIKFKRKED
jgi:hypothetical protein